MRRERGVEWGNEVRERERDARRRERSRVRSGWRGYFCCAGRLLIDAVCAGTAPVTLAITHLNSFPVCLSHSPPFLLVLPPHGSVPSPHALAHILTGPPAQQCSILNPYWYTSKLDFTKTFLHSVLCRSIIPLRRTNSVHVLFVYMNVYLYMAWRFFCSTHDTILVNSKVYLTLTK